MFSDDEKIAESQRYLSPSEELLNKFCNHLLKINKIDGNLIQNTLFTLNRCCNTVNSHLEKSFIYSPPLVYRKAPYLVSCTSLVKKKILEASTRYQMQPKNF
jgi:hypothetical protein